jgi:tellurite resistance protein TerC
MIEGAPYSYWIAFHVLVLVLLVADLFLLQGKNHQLSVKVAWAWTGFLAVLAGLFAVWILYSQGRQPSLEFVSGYLIETSLSVDNLFVFLLLFRSFSLKPADQHRALLWGIAGAIIMRALFIAAGVSLLDRFHWVQYVFGVILLIAAIRLMRHSPEASDASSPDASPSWIRWIKARAGEPGGKLGTRTFVMIVLAVEITDVIFALDSIPAVLAVTRRPFIAYTSNIFAILGLRSLFFALSGFLDRFRLLHYGLAAILAFVALKMLTVEWITVPVGISLGIILLILVIFIVLSLKMPPKPAAPKGA